MLSSIIDWSLGHRGLVLLGAAAVVLLGVFSLAALPFDAYPDATDVLVQVNTVAPALSPEEIERQVTARVEQVMGGLPGLKLLRSISKYGLSQVSLIFDDGTDLWFARSQVLERLQAVELPAGIERPTMGPVATGLGEIYHYLVTVPGDDGTAARIVQDWIIKPKLLATPGVAEVNAWGGFERQLEVIYDPMRGRKHAVTLADLEATLARANLNVGGGGVVAAGELLLVAGQGRATTVAELGAITVASADGQAVRVRDVSDVVEARALRRGVVTADGRGETVLGLGFMLMGENSRVVARRLRDRMTEIVPTLPDGARVRVVYDRTHLTDLVLKTVRQNLFEGALLVIAILFLFLGHLRAAALVALSIPLSMLVAFSCMARAGVAGTLMSLGAVDFGLVADSSVVLVENCVRRLGLDGGRHTRREVIAAAAKEVRAPTIFGEMIIMVVYIPILALEGVEGKLFRPMALTVIFALLGSLLFSMTLMPVLASFLLSRGSGEDREPWIVRAAKVVYRPLVKFAVDRRFLVLGAGILTVIATVPVALKLGATFVPRLEEGSIVINTIRLPGVSVEESARFGTRIERLLLREFADEVDAVWTRTGTPEIATDPMGIEVSDVFLMLTPRERWRRARTHAELVTAMDRVLRPLPGMNYAFTQPIEMRFNEMISGVRTDVGVKIFGDDFETLRGFGERVRAILATLPTAVGPAVEPLVGQPVLQTALRPDALARHGLAPAEVLATVEAIGGRAAGEVMAGQLRFPLVVRLPDHWRENPDLVRTLPLTGPEGQSLTLGDVADVTRTSGPMVVTREWGKRRAVVTCNVAGTDLAGFVAEARRRIDAELGADLAKAKCWVEFGGQFENLVRASKRLAIVVPVALALILTLLYATYGNVGDCARVFLSVPFAIAGGVWALHLRDLPFSISAGVGFVALSGCSVLEDMVLVSAIRDLMAGGMAPREAAIEAAVRRLRPVLMTSLVASLGFVPMAFNTGVGAEVQRPLATVLIGGVITGGLETMFLLPTLYVAMRRKRPAGLAPPPAGAEEPLLVVT